MREQNPKFYRESHRDWGLVGMKRIVLPSRYRGSGYCRSNVDDAIVGKDAYSQNEA